MPPTVRYKNNAAFSEELRRLRLPVLAKPTRGSGGEGIQQFDSFAAVETFLAHLDAAEADEYIVQQYIRGYDIDCSVLCRDGEILAYTIQRGFAARQESFAAPAGIDFVEDAAVLALVQRLMRRLNWCGVAHLDMRHDFEDNKVKVVEINARYWGSLLGSLLMGVNFPYLACLAALAHPFEPPRYRLGRYVAPTAAITTWVRSRLSGQPSEFSWAETGLPHLWRDPLAEAVKILPDYALTVRDKLLFWKR